ncbi:MAG: hypothetical protein FWE87_03750 [Coriobacteriia bacterium]|nr:hypothetical protein [Coriobacteriia bacterium]
MSAVSSDPYIRILLWIGALVLVGALLSVINALWLGVIDLSGTPRTRESAELIAAQSSLELNPDNADAWQTYLLALMESGTMSEAQRELDRAQQRDVDVTRGQQLLFIQAMIEKRSGNDEEATDLFRAVADKTMEAYIVERDSGSTTQNWAIAYGVHPNYGLSLLEIARIEIKHADWHAVDEVLTQYLETYPTEAGVLVDRANARVEIGDIEGATSDYRRALDFIPDFDEALEGLQALGVKQ